MKEGLHIQNQPEEEDDEGAVKKKGRKAKAEREMQSCFVGAQSMTA